MEKVVARNPRVSWDEMLQRDLDQIFPDSLPELKKLSGKQKAVSPKNSTKVLRTKVA